MKSIPIVQLGRTNLRIPVLGLGCAPLGNPTFADPAHNLSVETVQSALAKGVNFFDTAPLYGAGRSERYIGHALAGTPRDAFVLSSKVGRLVDAESGKVTYDFSRDGVLRSIEESLVRLQMDRIDIVHIHDADNHFTQALNESYPALAELRDQGVIGAISAGMNQWEMEAEFARSADFDCFLLAGRYTLLEQHSLDFLDMCHSRKIGVILGGVYNSGILAVGARPGATYNYRAAEPQILKRVAAIQAVCEAYDVPLKRAALQFPLAHPGVTAMVVGAVTPAEVAENVRNVTEPIPVDLWADLKAQGLIQDEAPIRLL